MWTIHTVREKLLSDHFKLSVHLLGCWGPYYEKLTFSGIWGVIVGLWCCHTPRNFEKDYPRFFE